MKLEHLIRMYGWMRLGLLVSVPMAMWGLVYWMSGGEMLAAWLFGLAMLPPLIDTLPSVTEVRRTLKTRKTSDHIWYMVEYQDGTIARM